jgi:hypothetical protein
MKIWGPFWRPPLTNIEIWDPFWRSPLTNIKIRDPFWRSQTTWNSIWRFLLTNEIWDPFWRSPLINLESHLAIPFIQSWNTRSLLATSFNQYRNTRSLLAISNNSESHLAIPYYQSWYQCRSSWWQGSKLFIFSLFLVLLVVPESTMVQTVILCYHKLSDSFFAHNFVGLH